MAKRTHYHIIVKFTYSNGTTGGVLDTTVNSKATIDVQIAANQMWLDSKGHKIESVEINPIN